MKYDHTAVTLKNPLAINVKSHSVIHLTRQADCSRKVQGHEDMLIVECIVGERLGQSAAVYLFYIAQRVTGISDSMKTCV